ncbi:MAG: ABC transporter permease [Oscillospiraceae bacterium]|nr:ABC transporter permease [Oscillospiraceae bacterium]
MAKEYSLKNIKIDHEYDVHQELALPPVNEFKRFAKVFFRRPIVGVGFAIVVLLLIAGIFADQIAPHDPYLINLFNTFDAPSARYPLGTDAIGRCLLSRIIHGTRLALLTGVSTVFISATIGITIGLVAGFGGRVAQEVVMRLTDAWISIPAIIIMMLLGAVLGRGIGGMTIAIGVTMFPAYIRLVFGQVLTVKQNDYIMASMAMGDSKVRIVLRHVLPNCLAPIIVVMTMMMGGAVMAEAGLSFIGLGMDPPTPAWGTMTNDGRQWLASYPHLSLAPGAAIVLLVFGFNMVGDGIRDALDPKMRGTLN